MQEQTEKLPFREIYEAGQEQVKFDVINGLVTNYLVPQNMKLINDMELVEKMAPQPFHLRQKVTLLTPQSFIDYYNRFADDNSVIFFDSEKNTFTAILDYHQATTDGNDPRHGHHQCTYTCPKTPEWSSWEQNDNKKMSQEDFALFIEDNLREITNPEPATMLEIATSLKAKMDVDWQSNIKLDNGQIQMGYRETINGQAGITGQLEIPQVFDLTLQPFVGGPAYPLQARFRYRINGGNLVLWYTLIRPRRIVDDATADVRNLLDAQKTRGTLLDGRPQ